MNYEEREKRKAVEAARLVEQIVRLKTTEVPVRWKRKLYDGTVRDAVSTYELCIVNGEKYIRKNCFDYVGSSFITNMENNGTIKNNDIIHFYNQSGKRIQGCKINTLIKTDTLLKLKDDMMEYLRRDSWSEDKANRVYEAIGNTSVAISENVIDEEQLQASKAAYARRLELLRENARENRKRRWSEERKMEQDKSLQQSLQPERESLKDLVEKIQEMGWEVTLKLKSDDNR